MPVSPEFREHILDLLRPLGAVTTRAMFGGHGLFLNGAIFGLLASDRVYFKSDATNAKVFEAADLQPFRPFPDRPSGKARPNPESAGFAGGPSANPYTMGYYEPPESALEDGEELCRWARLGVEASIKAGKRKSGGKSKEEPTIIATVSEKKTKPLKAQNP